MVRVVAVLPAYPPVARVGAFLATHELLADLATRGHHVSVLRRMVSAGAYVLDGVSVDAGRQVSTLETAIRAADVVISHLGDYRADLGHTPRLAQKHAVPLVRIVHGHDPGRYARLRGAELVVFNSQNLADASKWPGRHLVVHPPVRKLLARKPGSRVTLVNLSQEKGGELFWRLASKMPDVRFLGVKGGWGLQLIHHRPNVEIVGPTANMSDVYASTRVLLMPSERESWGMCALEAAQSGIPTICHPTPGLLESMAGYATFADRDNETEWVDAIRRLLDPVEWAAASELANERAALIDNQAGLDRFAEAVESLVAVAA